VAYQSASKDTTGETTQPCVDFHDTAGTKQLQKAFILEVFNSTEQYKQRIGVTKANLIKPKWLYPSKSKLLSQAAHFDSPAKHQPQLFLRSQED